MLCGCLGRSLDVCYNYIGHENIWNIWNPYSDLFPAQLAIFPWSLWVEKIPIRSHSNVVITGYFFQRLSFQDNLVA